MKSMSSHFVDKVNKLVAGGDYGEAIHLIHTTPALSNSSEIQYIKALSLYKTGRCTESLQVLERNLFYKIAYRESIDLWLHINSELNTLQYAKDKLSELCDVYPDVVEFAYGLGSVSFLLGDFESALNGYELANKISPGNFRILNSLAKLHLVTGELNKSKFYAKCALDINPISSDALRIVSMEHSYQLGDLEFELLLTAERYLSSLPRLEQLQLLYTLSKAYLDVDQLDYGFDKLKLAGVLHKEAYPLNTDLLKSVYQNLKAKVTLQNLMATGDSGCVSTLPLFILGMPRSGSTLLEQILSSHDKIYGAGEQLYIGRVIEGMRFGNFTLKIGNPSPVYGVDENVGWGQRGLAFVNHLNSLAGSDFAYVIDKMPANYHYVGMIHALLPNATLIHMMRHPMEVCFSCYKTLFSEGHEWSYALNDLAFQYRQYWEIMKHWNSEFPGLLFEVYYENLIADPEFETRRILDRLGLPWDSKCLEFHKSNRPVKTASVAQVRKPIYQTSNNRWKRYEKYLSPLAEQLSDIIAEYETMLQNSRNNA